jgi:hypothetical protein
MIQHVGHRTRDRVQEGGHREQDGGYREQEGGRKGAGRRTDSGREEMRITCIERCSMWKPLSVRKGDGLKVDPTQKECLNSY